MVVYIKTKKRFVKWNLTKFNNNIVKPLLFISVLSIASVQALIKAGLFVIY